MYADTPPLIPITITVYSCSVTEPYYDNYCVQIIRH
jgi:hypothetical protein